MARTNRSLPGFARRKWQGQPVYKQDFIDALRRGHVELSICGDVRDGHLDTYEEVSGMRSKQIAKRASTKAFRRIGKKLTDEQLD